MFDNAWQQPHQPAKAAGVSFKFVVGHQGATGSYPVAAKLETNIAWICEHLPPGGINVKWRNSKSPILFTPLIYQILAFCNKICTQTRVGKVLTFQGDL